MKLAGRLSGSGSLGTVACCLVVGSIAMLLAGCSEPSPAELDRGEVTGGVYRNSFFELELAVPAEWSVTKGNSEEIMWKAGELGVKEQAPDLGEGVDASRDRTERLLTLTRFEPGTRIDLNPNLLLMGERIDHLPGLRNGDDYLLHNATTLVNDLGYELVRPAHPVEIGGRGFHRADLRLGEVTQSFIATLKGPYALTVILSATTPEQMRELEALAASIRFATDD